MSANHATWDVERMQEAVAPMDRASAIGFLRRRPGSAEGHLMLMQRSPDGSPPNYPAAVDDLEAYGHYLVAFARAVRDK